MSTQVSSNLIKEWYDYEQVGIWDNCRWSVRLYDDRAIYKGHTVRWVNNSGSLADVHERWTGKVLDQLKKIAQEEKEDDADYTDQVYAIIRDQY
ncbi:MAG: hypothetical protein PHX80_03935 [Candidatus Nanoarchaeia archaeon]|nr:hypothetical protein [Candidatus Nanoarchaeia archaeon]